MTTVEAFLASLGYSDDPLLRAFMEAPLDDEPITAEDIANLAEGRAAIARGEGIPWEEVEARLFPNY